MENFLAVVHLIVAIMLIGLVLLQDSKSGSMGGAFGGGGSNSVFGATGATTLAQRLTQIIAVVFAISCIVLSMMSSHKSGSVIDSVPSLPATNSQAPVTAPTGSGSDTPTTASSANSPTGSAPATESKATGDKK